MWDRRARLDRVKDGDTFVAVLDQGFGDSKQIDVRLLGVYAPERGQLGFEDCTAFTRRWLDGEASSTGARWPFVVTTARMPVADREQSTLGRYVATVTSLDGSRNLNIALAAFIAENGYPRGDT